MTTFAEHGYTDQQTDAIHQTIKPYLKPDADWPRLLSDITMLVSDVQEGHAHQGTVLFSGPSQQRLQAVRTGLEAAAKAYDQLGDPLQAHIEGQQKIPERCDDCEYRQWKDWAAIVFEQTGTQIGDPPLLASDLPDQRPYALGRFLDHALAAVRQALERPIDPMIAYVQEKGTPKKHEMRLIVTELLEIFERATGIEATVSAQSRSKSRKFARTGKNNDPLTEYKGTAYPFLVACLAPAFPNEQLDSAIRTAYKEWNNVGK